MKFGFPSTRISVLQKMAPTTSQRLVVVGGPLSLFMLKDKDDDNLFNA